jgi:opine dehydrogenase
VLLAETETLAYACRLERPGRPEVKAVKRALSLAALPASETGRALAIFRDLYPAAQPAGSVLETALGNLNPVIHPPIVLGNARPIEADGRGFDLYGEGVSPGVARLIDALDADRRAVAAGFEVDHCDLHDWVERAYGVRARSTEEMCRTLAVEVYRGIRSPDRLDSRYLTEDVPDGLVTWSELGRVSGVRTPAIDAVVQLASILNGRDHRATGRTLERLGLAGLDAEGLREAVE